MSKTYEEFLKEQQKLSAQQKNADIKNAHGMFDAQVESVKGTYEPEKKNIELVYSDAIDENNVQRIINERQIAESMANAGSTDSGLNRTQMTASQLSHSNNYAKLRRQEQAAFDELDRAIAQEISKIEQNRQSTVAGIESEYAANDRSVAASMFNKQQEEETARYKATLELAEKKSKARGDLITSLSNEDLNDTAKMSLYQNYINTYGLDASDSALDAFGNELGLIKSNDGTTVRAYTNNDVAKYKRLWNSRNIETNNAVVKIKEFLDSVDWSASEKNEFIKAVTGSDALTDKTLRDNAGTVNPADYEYTVIDEGDPDGDDFEDAWGVANDEWDFNLDAIVVDEFGVERTASDLFHNARLYFIRQEHLRDWNTWSKTGDNLKNALNNEGSSAWNKALKVVKEILGVE